MGRAAMETRWKRDGKGMENGAQEVGCRRYGQRARMTEDTSSKPMTQDTSANTYREEPIGSHPYQHGRPASWVLVAVIIAAFCVGGVAVIGHLWGLFWVCVGIVVLSVPAGKIIGIMNDTVAIQEGPRVRAAVDGRHSAADPGVRLH
jgi:hypothetical protein